nr:PREDICTED: fat-like cadherin-related tumor suppressor homolog isoform X2 [Bemisia tabaci]
MELQSIGAWQVIVSIVFLQISISEPKKDAHCGPSGPVNQPRFTKCVYNATIPENSIKGKTYVTPEEKMGIYRGNYDVDVKFKIISGDKMKFFRADDRLVGDFWFLLIRTKTSNSEVLNREREDKYELEVKATITARNERDKRHTFHESIAKVVVTVLDTNDLIPSFYPYSYEEFVPEDTPLHASILRVSADDADLGRNGEIYYSFSELDEQFAVHPTTGVISLTRPLSFVDKSYHELTVLARDRGAPLQGSGKPASAVLKIHVKQVNLYSPEIYVQQIPDIVEQSNADIYAIVRVEDKDKGIHGEIDSIEIVDGDPDGHFRIRPSNIDGVRKKGEYNIEVLKLLDRETAPQGYNLTLRAIDKGTPPRQAFKSVQVHLADVNDNAPIFDREVYEVDVPETIPINSPVIRLKVSDADQGKNAQVILEIVSGNDGGEFYVNPETGMLYTAAALDAETKVQYTLAISAIDQGNAGTRKQSSARVKINVIDTNDNNPVFEHPAIDVTVNENEPSGTSVIKVSAKDKDKGENAYISYSIANLKPVPFEIDHFSGVIKTTQVLDFESSRRSYVLRIRASDWGLPYRRQTEMQVKINVKDINDNRPQFEKVDCRGHVSRSTPINSEVMTLSAIDFDAGNIISYRIVSGNEDGCFGLDEQSGILSVKCDLADVDVSERDLNVTATDGTHFADIVQIRIMLNDQISKNDPWTKQPIDGFGENSDFQCKDTGVARRLQEVIASANKNNAAADDSQEFAMMPSRYGENLHSPEFIDFPVELQVNESAPFPSVLLRVRARDRDLGYNGALVYGISSGDTDSVFQMNSSTGELNLIGRLDRERETKYVLNISVFDLGKPQKSASKTLLVTVLDVNDNAPKFSKSLASFRVSEVALNGTVIFRLNATDADLGNNGRFLYSLLTDTQDFAVDPITGALTVSGNLDREKQDTYELKIRATDCADTPGNIHALHSDALVRIQIDDFNDNVPTFSAHSYTVKVREDTPVGSVVVVLIASDPDLGEGGQVRYSMVGELESNSAFTIDRLTGAVRIVKPLDFEDRQVHSLSISAKDNGDPQLSSETVLIVEVVDVNENFYAPHFKDFVVNTSVAENQPAGTIVTTVSAADADLPGDNSRVGYSVQDGSGLGYFSIDNEGVIRTLAPLDAESKPHYWLTVFAYDHGVVPLHSRLEVFVAVSNVNDNVPLTEKPAYTAYVPESSGGGSLVLQLSASDADLDPAQNITYRITSGNPESFFNIDHTSGLITTTGRKLDRENQQEHALEITVCDDGTPSLSSTTRVTVIVNDTNDNAPIFDQNFYTFRVPQTKTLEQAITSQTLSNLNSGEIDAVFENFQENGTWQSFEKQDLLGDALFRVIAVDADTDENARLSYSLQSGKNKGKFTIDPDTGTVYSDVSLAPNDGFYLMVRASDQGSPNKSATTRVSVQVVAIPDESEHPPTLHDPILEVQVTENDPVGFLVAIIQASDEDQDFLWYQIIDGDPESNFMISRDKGTVILAKKLDWETTNKYKLNISVSDGVHTVYSQLIVSVVDINEHPPIFSQSVYKTNISERSSIGSEVLRVEATDLDAENKVLYSLHAARNPTSLHLFKINYQTGAITISHDLDWEGISEHLLIVMARDYGTPAKKNFATVIINVYDANDHAPEFSSASSIQQGQVFETASIGTIVAQVVATDKDHGVNAAITFSITSGNVANAFSIDPVLGTIQVAKELDMSAMSEYMLIVKAVDGGTPQMSSTLPVYIMLVMADNAPPKFLKREVAAELYENEPAGTIVTQLEVRSVSLLQYEILTGNMDDMFTVNPTMGIVTTKRPLDYEQNKVYNLTISATNMAGAKAVCSVVVHVLDKNDHAPTFTKSVYYGFVNEGTPIGSLVLSNSSNLPLIISATDNDAETNALLHYDIVESGPKRIFHIVPSTGAVRTVVMLDYETTPSVEFHVLVSDLGKPQLSSDILALVHIDVVDVNDCPPVFMQPYYNATILLPTYPNIVVAQVNATDKDSANLTKLVYSITNGNAGNIYSISSSTGVITLKDPAKGQSTSPHALKVSVTDGRFTTDVMVYISWEKSENSGLIFQKSLYQGVVQENNTKVMTVAVVNVLGSELNEHLVFSILNPSPMFEIGRTSGAIRTTGVKFDREAQEYQLIIVQALSFDGEKTKVAHVPVNITVLDTNDNCPMFVNLPYYAVVSLDARKGEVITKVHAIDLDKGENGEVCYELTKGQGELFKVSRLTGEIVLKQSLEGHNREYQLTVAAYDGGTTPCRTEVAVIVKVIDRSLPVFDKQFYAVSVPEDIDIHTPLSISINAESALNRKLIYSISGGNINEQFAIDFNTAPDSNNGPCVLYVVDELDYETRQDYSLTVRATDSISGVYAEVLVSVIVTDVNDSPPEFLSDFYNVSVSEAAPFGSFILKVTAKDRDTGDNKLIRYSIQKDNSNPKADSNIDYFHVNPEDGSIFLKKSLDHETHSSHHIIIVASDNGTPSLSTTAHVWLTVEDVNDNPPKLEPSVFECRLSEDAIRGQFVTVITASDPDSTDHGKLTYLITSGNEQQTFSMDPTKGIITLMNLQKLSETRMHSLNISVSDGVYTSFARVHVEILSANRYSPVFDEPLYEAKIDENMLPGQKVTRVRAVDKDSGVYGQVSYSIPSDYLSEIFHINNLTGEVITKQSLDREKTKVYELPVMGTDGGGRSSFTAIRVRVGDNNDNPPVFHLPEYKICIQSNLALNSGILKVRATDPDENLNAQVEYSIYENTGSGVKELFSVNRVTGGLTLLKPLVPFENQVFQFFVRATDKGTPALHADVPVNVYVMTSEDKPPVFERSDDKFFVSEAAVPQSVITKVKLVSETPAKFRLICNADLFSIDDEGQIQLTGQLDHETASRHVIGVLAYTDSSPPLTALSEIHLQVLDVNDNSPRFHSEEYHVSVAENIPKGTQILKVLADDKDEGSDGEVQYTATGPTSDIFTIDSHTGWLTSLIPLDRETQELYSLTVIATDSGTSQRSSTATVHVKLIDYNDNPPKFSQDSYSASVNENSLPGTVITQLSVTDADSGQSPIQYFITSGDSHVQFSIRSTGEVFVARALDREFIDSYELTILATDGKFVTSTNLTLNILDANDEQPYCLKSRYHQVLVENINPDSFLLKVDAVDADLNPKLKFYLTGEKSEDFSLDKVSGELKTARPLDRETWSHYSLVAHVQDKDRPEFECTSIIDITLTDLNDNAPAFTPSKIIANIPEDSDIGTLVTKVHATDNDVGLNRKIRYTLIDSAKGFFNIAPESGLITLMKRLDRETQDLYNLTVKASDQGNPPLSNVTNIEIVVLDVNDNPPEFMQRSYQASVSESVGIGTEVAKVTATSSDVGINAEIMYSIIGGNEHGKFMIDPDTGVIKVSQLLDYERGHEYLLTIQATDKGVPPLSNQAAVNITVRDFNDNPPLFRQIAFIAKIREDAHPGDIVTQVSATDLDSGLNGKIAFTIERGDSHQQFAIERDTGYITVARPLDREMVANYNLQIQATDLGDPPLSSFVMLNIEILDVNDNNPLFTQTNYTAVVQEGKNPGWTVFKLSVTDNDISPNTEPYTFDIRDGNVGGAFQVEPDGRVRTAARLNHQLQESYQLLIRVFDNGTPPLFSDTTLTVKVFPESQFPPAVTPLEIWVGSYQDRWPGGELGKVFVSDKDPYDTLSYNIVGPYSNYFSIDSRTGTLSAGPGLDSGKYYVNVSVSDGKFTTNSSVYVMVEPLWDETLNSAVSIRLSNVNPHQFILNQRKGLMKSLRSALKRDVSLISVQETPQGHLDILLAVKQDIDLVTMNEALKASGLTTVSFPCECVNGSCKQHITLHADKITPITTDITSFVAPAHSHRLYCACHLGFTGERCDMKIQAICNCSENEKCILSEKLNNYSCELTCVINNTCPPPMSSGSYSITWEELVASSAIFISIIFLVCIFILYRNCRSRSRASREDKNIPVLNSDVKRTSKLSNLEVTQCGVRPASYVATTHNDVHILARQLNNLDTLRSYGSAGDELETVPPDYLRNLNNPTPGNKINNDLKRVSELTTNNRIARRSLSCVEDEARMIGGYHWDCSDWVRRSQTALPNITEVPGSEVPDSSSFHSNESNESNLDNTSMPLNEQNDPSVLSKLNSRQFSDYQDFGDPARDLANLDEELYMSYRSEEDDVIPYGFPVQNYISHSDLSTNVCDIEDSDVPA